MKALSLSFLLACFQLATPLLSAQEKETPGWRLTFEENFDKPGLDTKVWNPNDPWGSERNDELQAYVPNAFKIENGILKIIARERRAYYSGKTREYTSGIASTYGKFSQAYGRFEIRCKVPKGKGFWPAFWMLPMPLTWPPEIDVLEILGASPNEVHMTHHWKSNDPTKKSESNGQVWEGPDFSADFHTFAVEWDTDKIVWFVDDIERHRSIESIPSGPMFLLINLAIGGWADQPDKHTLFPSSFQIDYVRVYERIAPKK